VSCSSSEALFEAYLDRTLTPVRRASLAAHLRSCGRCTGVLEELRVVDALLAAPSPTELPPNFTFATMAEVRSLGRPRASAPPVAAYLVCYLVAAWLLIGAAFLVETASMHALGETALDVSRELTRALGTLGHASTRLIDDFGSVGALVEIVLALNVTLALAAVVGVAVMRPRIAARLRP